MSEEVRNSIAAVRGARRAKKLRGVSRLEVLEITRGLDPAVQAAELRLAPEVELAEPNYLIKRSDVVPSDPMFAEQWALRNEGQGGGASGADVRAAAAWATSTGASTTVVAVVDSGIDFTHPDLVNNRWVNGRERANGRDDDRNGFADDLHGWDWVAGDGLARDEQGHGTAVAGVIAAEGNNGEGVAGVMWRASLMSLRVLDGTGTGDVAAAVEAIDYAAGQGAQVINLSWGTDGESEALRGAIRRAGRAGAVVVAAAGNGGRDIDAQPHYPAAFELPNLIAVASVDNTDSLTSWSNWGGRSVEVAAPGVDILTTKAGGGYQAVTGTSVSAPLVSGAAGLLKTLKPWLSAEGVREAVLGGSRRVIPLGGWVSAGGVLSVSGALSASAAGNPYTSPGGEGGAGNGNGGGAGENGGGAQNPRPPNPGFGGRRPDDFRGNVPAPTRGPAQGFPNLDEIANRRSHVPAPVEPVGSVSAANCSYCYNAPGTTDPQFSTARAALNNETGQPGVDLGSRNFNWSARIVSAPGRAGLDLNLSLYYNSLVWSRQGSSIQFNPDNGFPGPGFSLGVPVMQKRYFDSATGAYAYMLVTPSGARVSLRQVGASNVYESVDSTYTQFDAAANLLRTTDGMQYFFVDVPGGEKRCTLIKDRNGNFITIGYDAGWKLTTITDTLARVFRLNYDGAGNLSSVTQDRAGGAYTWATFTYGQVYMQPSFSGLTVYGPVNQYATVLTRVTFPDGSYNTFEYNPFGQAHTIRRYAPDNTQLSYTGYNLPGSYWAGMSGQSDCPRFTERRHWVLYGVMNNSQEVVITYDAATDGSWSQALMPDGTLYKEFFATSGWGRGLTTQSEVWSGGVRRKYTTFSWTQDDTALSWQKNPRVTETNVYDEAGNRRRTTVEYHANYVAFGLPWNIVEYAADGSTPVRRTYIDYKMDSAYISRRVIGLVFRRAVYDGNWNLNAKTEYHYDWGGSDMFVDTPAAATQHDRTNYGPGFLQGRGNLSNVIRFNVQDEHNAQNTVQETKFRYDAAGSLLMERDHGWHPTYYEYADSYSDGNNGRNTFAYATKVTDPDGHFSTAQYDYNTGAVTRKQDPKGAVSTIQYDAVGRTERVTNAVNNAYTRYVYPASLIYTQSFTTVRDASTEVRSEVHYDGAGRVRATSEEFPGSAGGYRAVHYMYDSMGRRVQGSNPTEINASWLPSGDDAAGWVWTTQAYDWQGRPTVSTRPDGSTAELSYGGCGCAGGEQVTARDERGRRRRLTEDVFGRLVRAEELNWDQSVYSTATFAYNTRDQITAVRHYQGTEASGVYQERSFTYDGHGRLASRTTPEQGTTTYAYNGDDTLNTVTDARGATTTYGYNGRHLITSIGYGVPAGVAATPNVTFAYDAAGNRTSMADGHGTVTYNYDTLSRMTWEERNFGGVGAYRINYDYNVSGQLTSVTNPWGSQFSFGRDAAGRVTGVGGAGAVSVAAYAQNIAYRAHGGVKHAAYGNGRALSVTYDNRLRMKQWDVSNVVGWEYYYNHFGENTGRVTHARNLHDAGAGGRDGRLDRSYDYDHVGRLVSSTSGSNSRAMIGTGETPTHDGPYSQAYGYDVWGNLTLRQGWGGEAANYAAGFNNKNQRAGFTYDAAGNLLNDLGQNFTYDATGQQATASYGGYSLDQGYDGDTLRVKKTENGDTTFYLRSSVLGGQVLAEVKYYGGSWGWWRGYVYGGDGGLMAIQSDGTVRWVHQDPVTKSQRITDTAGGVAGRIELDPWGGVAGGWTQNAHLQPRKFGTYERDGNGSDEAMMRRFNRWHSRFDQPDPYNGSFDPSDPQSFNRYAYAGNDPVNRVDPLGLDDTIVEGGIDESVTVIGTVNQSVFTMPGVIVTRLNPGGVPYGPTGGGNTGGHPQGPVPQPHPTPTPTPTQNLPSKLSDCVKALLAPYFKGLNLDRVNIKHGIPFYVMMDADAYTQRNNVHFKSENGKSAYDPHSIGGIALIAHEVTHVKQFADLGLAGFGFVDKYVGEYISGRIFSMESHRKAYENISLERKAREMGERVRRDLEKQFNGKDPCPR